MVACSVFVQLTRFKAAVLLESVLKRVAEKFVLVGAAKTERYDMQGSHEEPVVIFFLPQGIPYSTEALANRWQEIPLHISVS